MRQIIKWSQLTELSFRETQEWENFLTDKNFVETYKQWDNLTAEEAPPIEIWKTLNESNIGRIIEYIDEYVDFWSIHTERNESTYYEIYKIYFKLENREKLIQSTSMINTLWKALRYVFENIVDWSED